MFQFLRNMRIRSKLFVAYSCTFLLAFAVAGVFIYAQAREIIRENVDNELTNTTQTILSMVRTSADVAIKNYMRAVAEKNYDVARQLHRQVKRGLLTKEEAKERARQIFRSQAIGKTGRIYCLDSEGVMVVNPKRSLVGMDLSGLPFVKEQIRKKNGYMEYDWKEPLQKVARPKAVFMKYFKPWDWIISASSYRDEFNEIINIDDFRERILDLGFGESGYPFVLNRDGIMLIHPYLKNKHFSNFGDQRLSNVGERILHEKNGKFEYMWYNPGDTDFRRKVVYFNEIPEMGWIVGSTSYHDEFYGPLDAIRNVILTSLAIALVLMIPISIWVGSLISRPIKRLQYNFAQAASGDFSVRMRKRSNDELGLLAAHFNSFMDQLNTFSTELKNEINVRKEAEQRLIEHDKARTLFLSSASHELRTPLTSIIGFLKLMEKSFIKQFRPHLVETEKLKIRVMKFENNLKVVRSEADRLGRLVNDLLDLNKIESGRIEWRDEDISVTRLLTNAGQAMAAYAEGKPAVQFFMDKPETESILSVDSDRIHQVLINLLSNAFKYTETGMVTLSAITTKTHVNFLVRDTGRGISRENIDKVFDIFYQVQDENMRSSTVFGTGLGLAISRQIIEHYGGEISVESTIGKGSLFSFTIPLG